MTHYFPREADPGANANLADLAGIGMDTTKKEIDPDKAAGNAFYKWKRKMQIAKKATEGKNKLKGAIKIGAIKDMNQQTPQSDKKNNNDANKSKKKKRKKKKNKEENNGQS